MRNFMYNSNLFNNTLKCIRINVINLSFYKQNMIECNKNEILQNIKITI